MEDTYREEDIHGSRAGGGCSKGTEVSDSITRSPRGRATSASLPLPFLPKCLFFPFPGELRKT